MFLSFGLLTSTYRPLNSLYLHQLLSFHILLCYYLLRLTLYLLLFLHCDDNIHLTSLMLHLPYHHNYLLLPLLNCMHPVHFELFVTSLCCFRSTRYIQNLLPFRQYYLSLLLLLCRCRSLLQLLNQLLHSLLKNLYQYSSFRCPLMYLHLSLLLSLMIGSTFRYSCSTCRLCLLRCLHSMLY